MTHICTAEAHAWFEGLDATALNIKYGAIVDTTIDDCVVKNHDDPLWMLEVNLGEFRGPIRFWPLLRAEARGVVMADKPQYDEVVPVHARHDQVVEVHWRLASGQVVIVRVMPPEVE